jgi:hypothetical protein
MLPGFFMSLTCGAVVLGWLYERSGALAVVAVGHTMLNMSTSTRATEVAAPFVSIVVILWAIWIVRTDRLDDNGGAASGRLPQHWARDQTPLAQETKVPSSQVACPLPGRVDRAHDDDVIGTTSDTEKPRWGTPTGEPCPRSQHMDGRVEGSGNCHSCGFCLLLAGLVERARVLDAEPV